MKKLLGISLVAILAATPMMASAGTPVAGEPEHLESGTTITEQTPEPEFALADANSTTDAYAASAGYVKGAYNAAIKAINKVNAKQTTSAGNGINKSNAGEISVKAKTSGGIAVDENGVAVVADTTKGITVGADGVAVNKGNGIDFESGAVAVKAKTNGGIAVSSDGVALDYASTGGLTQDTNHKMIVNTDGTSVTKDANGVLQVGTIGKSNISSDDIKVSTGTHAADTDLATEGFVVDSVATAVSGINTTLEDYATQANVVKTIKATTLSSNSTLALASGTVSGSVVIPIMDDWANDAASSTGLTSSNVSLTVGTTLTGGVTTTINPTSVSYNTTDCSLPANADNAACKTN